MARGTPLCLEEREEGRFHGAHNVAVIGRMHMEFTRKVTDHWYSYWTDQFEVLRAEAQPVDQQPIPTQHDPETVNG